MKIIRIILVNILIFGVLLFIFNYICFIKMTAHLMNTTFSDVFKNHLSLQNNNFTLKIKSFDEYYNKHSDTMFRPVAGEEYAEKVPLVLFGCSYAYGHLLPDYDVLSAQLANKTHRTVYNFAYPSWGTQEIIYLMQNNKKLRDVRKDGMGKQYLIYWYIPDHLWRLYQPFMYNSTYYFLTYNAIDGKLSQVRHSHPVLDAFYIYKKYKYTKIYTIFEHMPDEWKYRFLNMHLKKIIEEKEKLFPNAEFIMLVTHDMPHQEVEIINQLGIRVFFTQELTGINMEFDEEYTYENHPNEKANDILSDVLIKILDL